MALVDLILLHVMAIPATLFPLLYLRSQWSRHEIGRALMLSSVGLALLIDVSVLGIWLDVESDWVSDLTTTVVLAVILAGSVYQVVLLIRAQRRAKGE